MTLSLLIKLLLLLLFIPIAYAMTWAAQRNLAPTNRFRLFLEKHGTDKVARLTLIAVYALGGIWLTLKYS